MTRGHRGILQVFDIEAPIIVAMQGWSIGGSFQRALLCDIRIAADDARFMLPEATHGVIPDTGGVGRLFQMCGHGVVTDMVLTGRAMNAAEALAHGVVSRVVPRDELDATAREMAEKIAAAPAVTVKMARRVIKHLSEPEVRSSMADELIVPDVHQQVRRLRRVPGGPRRGARAPLHRELTMTTVHDPERTCPRPAPAARAAAGASALPAGTYDGATVFVTGGGTGLGQAIATEFARLGANIVDRQPQARAPRSRPPRPWTEIGAP